MSLEMKSDDANMIDDILNELNEDTANIQTNITPITNPPPQLSPATPTHGATFQPQNLNGGFAPPTGGQIPAMPNVYNPRVGVTTQGGFIPTINTETESKVDYFLNMIKKPLIVTAIVFVVFNSYTRQILSKTIPALFESTNVFKQQTVTLGLALIIGLILMSVDKVL